MNRINAYFQSLALGSKWLEIWKPVLIVLLKTKLMNICILIAIKKTVLSRVYNTLFIVLFGQVLVLYLLRE